MNWADPHAIYVAPAYALTALVFITLAAWVFWGLSRAEQAALREADKEKSG